MNRFFNNLFRSAPKAAVKTTTTLAVETLEDRMVPTVTTIAGGATVGTTIKIDQTNGDDTCMVQQYSINSTAYVRVVENGRTTANFNMRERNIQRIEYHGHYGNDSFRNATKLPSKAFGGYGNDRLIGSTTAVDQFEGSFGNDRLEGLGGNDILKGGFGNDLVYGGLGHDTINGEGDSDVLFGDDGNDVILGGAGVDYLFGGFDNDRLFGEGGKDFLFGEGGDDYLNGGQDGIADFLKGGLGRDTFQADMFALLSPLFSTNVDAPQDLNTDEGDVIAGLGGLVLRS